MLEVSVKGLDQLDKALRELPEKLQRNVARAGLRAGAKVIADEARRLVPVKSGKLRDTIRVTSRIRNGEPTASVKAGNPKKGVFYAHMIERGTAKHHIVAAPGKTLRLPNGTRVRAISHPGATKKPFMRPAADTQAQAAVSAFGAYMRRRIEKEGIDIPDPEPETD